jgi:LPPG:FO 2-phospho-L-lactate transferase
MFIALAGGVGGAKLASGLAMQMPPEDLLVIVNTGDDFTHLGLNISPDLDTVMYWLAGLNDRDRGWGVMGETWAFMDALEQLGGPTWFRLGDHDLATHVERTRRLNEGLTLSQITEQLCTSLGVLHHIAPMSDDSTATVVESAERAIPFQEYFVRLKCEPAIHTIRFDGIAKARPSAAFASAMTSQKLEAVLICPSNPFLSIDPILALPGVRPWLRKRTVPAVAVSPIVGGAALKGPAAKLMRELGHDVSAFGIAKYYRGLIDGLVIDTIDAALAPEIEALGIRVLAIPSVMKTKSDQSSLAKRVSIFASQIGGKS